MKGGDGLEQAAAIVGLALGASAVYAGLALLLEDARRDTLLPVFRSGRARAAVEGGLGAQLTKVENEAGVREQL